MEVAGLAGAKVDGVAGNCDMAGVICWDMYGAAVPGMGAFWVL
jgi:hypothetical protein